MVSKVSKNNHFISFYIHKTNFFFKNFKKLNKLAYIITIISTWQQSRSKSEADKKIKFSVQVLWAIVHICCKFGRKKTKVEFFRIFFKKYVKNA